MRRILALADAAALASGIRGCREWSGLSKMHAPRSENEIEQRVKSALPS